MAFPLVAAALAAVTVGIVLQFTGSPGNVDTPATGSVWISTAFHTRQLDIVAHGLKAVPGASYDVWLVDSRQDRRRLGALPALGRRIAYRLPANAASYNRIEVRYRPAGAHVTETLALWAANPARQPAGAHSSRPLTAPSPSWSDEFAGSRLDRHHWQVVTGGGGHGNDDLQNFKGANVHVSGGDLTLSARRTGGSITSGEVQSLGRVSAHYGLIEARIKVPRGPGMWPAFWMQGTDFPRVGWPRDGEIDVMEILGNDDHANQGSLHSASTAGEQQFQQTHVERCGCDLTAGYHTYAINWTPGRVQFMLDGRVYATETRAAVEAAGGRWAFDRPFFFILALAVGGSGDGNPTSATAFPSTMNVDWVRVYPNA